MSDIFSFNDDELTQNEHTKSKNEYWNKKNEKRNQANADYQEDLESYSVNISQEDFNIIKDAIANAEVPEDEAYRWCCAMELNKQYGMPVSFGYQNLEQINAALWGDRFTFTPKTNFKAIVDSGKLGVNTLKMGRLGNKIMKAEMFGQTDYNNYLAGKVENLDEMLAEYAAIEQENASLQDYEDRNFFIEALKFGAQSAPFTGYIAGVGLLGGLLSGGVGTAASFAASMNNAAGLEYMRLRQAGSKIGDAAGFAILSGGLQALVETSLGNIAGVLGKKTIGDLASQAVKNKITGNIFKRLAYDGTFKSLALRMGKEWLKENAEEGLEEVIQDLIEKGTDAFAAELGGYEIEPITAKKIASDAWENFRGGVMGSLILGLGPSAIKSKADIKEFVNVRKLAEVTPSQETFNLFTDNSTLWEGMSNEEKKNAQKTTWETAQARVEAAAELEAKKIAEGRDVAEGAEESPEENEDGTTESTPVARNEAGRLITQNEVFTDDDGNTTGGTFLVGDTSKKEEDNRYGYIKYTADEKGDITITDFKMKENREGLRAEVFDEFAREHPDLNIEWNAIGSNMQEAKQALVEANPSGANNGLNYYTSTELDNVAARKIAMKEIRSNIFNYKKNADGTFTKTELSNKQLAAAVTLIESAARRMNMGLADYINKTFGDHIFGSREEFTQATLAQGEDVNTKAGGTRQGIAQANWREVGQQVKAVIYAGEHADFSTWAHEMAHVFQNQLDGDLKTEAESAFNVVDGDWVNSTYTFKDGRTMSSAEAFAYGFQDWLETGKAENEQMKNIFQKFAQFIADAYNKLRKHLDFTPEIESVFNKLLDGDDTIMSKALKAAQEEEGEYRATLKRQAEEKEAQKKAEAEEAKRQAQAEREEASEGTDFEENAPTAEDLLNGIEEAENETTEENNAIDDALENLNLADDKKTEIAETLKDETSTVVEKAEVMTEAASSVYDEIVNNNPKQLLFMNELSMYGIHNLSEDALRHAVKMGGLANPSMAVVDTEKNSFTNFGEISLIPYNFMLEKGEGSKGTFGADIYSPRYPDVKKLVTPTGEKKINALFHGIEDEQLKTHLTSQLVNKIEESTRHFDFNYSPFTMAYLSDKGNTDFIKRKDYKYSEKLRNKVKELGNEYRDHEAEWTELYKEWKKNELKEQFKDKDIPEEEFNKIYDFSIEQVIDPETGYLHWGRGTDFVYNIFADDRDAGKLDYYATERAARELVENDPEFEKWAKEAYDRIEKEEKIFNGFTPSGNRRYLAHTLENVSKYMKQQELQGGESFYYGLGSTRAKFTPNFKTLSQIKKARDRLVTKEEFEKIKEEYQERFDEIIEALRGDNDFDVGAARFEEAFTYGKSDPIGYLEREYSNYGVHMTDELAQEILDFATALRTMPTEYFETKYTRPVELNEFAGAIIPSNLSQDLKDELASKGLLIEEYDTEAGNREEVTKAALQKFNEKRRVLFQDVYHGSPFDFENFSTESIGSGEGAQSFGWGLYFTNQEGIARFYADSLANSSKRITLAAKNDFLKSRKASLRQVEDKEKYEAKIYKNINHFKKELKQAQKAGDESEIKFYEGLIDDSIKQLDEKERLSLVEAFKKDIEKTNQEIKDIKDSMKKNRNLYTVEIPDEGYILWDKEYDAKDLQNIKKALYDRILNEYFGGDKESAQYEVDAIFTDGITGEEIYHSIQHELGSDKAASLFLASQGYVGIDYPANTIAGKPVEGERNYVIFDEANTNIKKHLLYQNAYHGSGADFDKFDTENYGLSGEGSMSFGYGTYLTDSEDIAREYAERQRKRTLNKESTNPYERGSLEYEMFEDLRSDSFNFSKSLYKKYLEKEAENIKKDPDNPYQDFKASEKLAIIDNFVLGEEDNKTNLYTVEIPDDGYLDWKENISKDEIKKIVSQLKDFYDSIGFEYRPEQLEQVLNVDDWYSYDGKAVYETLEIVSKGQKKIASQFLHSIGYAGIKYPAGTIHGNGNGAYNYVIFNDDDAKIVGHLFFQTQAELAEEARGFDSWQEFMDYCETFHADDDVSPIPGDADAQWYQSFWEISRGVETEQEKNEKTVKDKYEKEDTIAGALDAYFSTEVKSNPEILDNFLNEVARIDAIDLESDEWQRVENAEDAAERDNIDRLKDFINITLSDFNWQTALKRIQGGHEIAEGLRKKLVTEMTDSFKARDFRALYAEVMNDQQYAVSEEDSITATLNKKLKKYHDIVKPTDDISRWSPEKRKQLAEQLQNREIAAKIKNGSLKLDDELDAYIKSLTKQIREKQKQLDELDIETKADYQRFADAEVRTLLKLHDELLIARTKVTAKNSDINRKIAKGLKITEKYRLESQNLTANYDELFRKFYDLKNSIRITAEVQAALDRQEQVAGLKEDLNSKQKEKNLTAEIKKMRIQLVKRAMRRVPFSRIDYNSAKTVIAIQRMLEPNLLGGVNRFIGIDSPYLRGVISQIVTDSDYKERIMYYLSRNSKSSQAFMDFKKKLSELKSIKDFDSWTAKDRKAAIRYLPKENWVRDLNLKELAKEREESIDLDIGMEEYSRTVYDEKTGEPKTYKDKDGNDHNVTETAFRLQYKEELGQLVKDAVGADMFDKIINMPFSEWTTEDLEQLAQRIDEIYTEGRTLKAAKDEARRKAADVIRKRIEDAIKETGITINDDDTPEEKERKQKQIDKILGMSSDLKGTEAGKTKGFKARLNRLLHSYSDMNLMRFARMLDNQSEGENYRMLYRMEDDCYNTKQRSMNARAEKIYKVMKDNKITEGDLAKSIKVDNIGTEFTVDELLYFLAADKDYAEDEKKVTAGFMGLDANDDYAATSRNAVMFGNMMSDMASQEEKERWVQLDKQMEEAIKNDTLSTEQKQLLTIGQLDRKPGTSAYIATCHAKWLACLSAANSFIAEHPEYKALMEAIEEDYASQYERMNEVSINEFNMPVHRVKAYVPLVRREANGDPNVNQVKEDLLGAYGAESGKQWVNKGMTQRRVSMNPLNQKPVQTGLFTTWGSSIERTEHFIAYAPYVRQLNAVYKSRDAAYTRRFIEARYGRSALEYLDSYINEVANPNAGRIRERGAEWLHVLRGKTAPAYLGWKASAIIKQGLTSPWPYMQFVNPAEYLSAAMKFTFNPQMREAIKEKSVFMKMRRMDPVNDLIDEMADNAKTKLDRGWSNFSKIGMQGLEMIDWACVAPGWLACYEKKYNQLQNASEARYKAKMEELKERNMYADVGTSEYLSPQQMEAEARKEMMEDIETEAVRYADDCTRACQPSNRVTDLAPLFKNSSEAMKAFLQFQTSLNVIWQNIRYDIPYAVKQKEFKRIAGTIIGYVMAGIFMNSVMDGIGGDDDDDETQALRNLIYYSTTQFTDAIPIMGSEITNTMDQLITGKRGYASSGTDMTPSATKLLSVLTNAKKGNWTKAAELTAEGIGLYLGAPVSGAKEVYKLLGKPLDEGDVDLLRGISDVYGLAGDIIEK